MTCVTKTYAKFVVLSFVFHADRWNEHSWPHSILLLLHSHPGNTPAMRNFDNSVSVMGNCGNFPMHTLSSRGCLPLVTTNLHQYSQQAWIGIVAGTNYPTVSPKVHGCSRNPALFWDLGLLRHASWRDAAISDFVRVSGTARGQGPPLLGIGSKVGWRAIGWTSRQMQRFPRGSIATLLG